MIVLIVENIELSYGSLSEMLSVNHGRYPGSNVASIFPLFEECAFLFSLLQDRNYPKVFVSWRNFRPFCFRCRKEIFCCLKRCLFKKKFISLFSVLPHLWILKETFIIWYAYFKNTLWLTRKLDEGPNCRVEPLNL